MLLLFATVVLGGILQTGLQNRARDAESRKTEAVSTLGAVIPPRPNGIYEYSRPFLPAGIRVVETNSALARSTAAPGDALN